MQAWGLAAEKVDVRAHHQCSVCQETLKAQEEMRTDEQLVHYQQQGVKLNPKLRVVLSWGKVPKQRSVESESSE